LLGGVSAVLTEGDSSSEQAVPLTLTLAWGLGYLLWRGELLNVATVLASSWTAGALLVPFGPGRFDTTLSGAAMFAVGLVWAFLSADGLIAERTSGIVAGGVAAFVGAEIAAAESPNLVGFVLLGVLAVAGLGGYVMVRDLAALGVGAVSLAVVIPQAVTHYTHGGLGTAGALLVSGLSVIGVSVVGVRLRRDHPGAPASS
jgi:hypothetical protein